MPDLYPGTAYASAPILLTSKDEVTQVLSDYAAEVLDAEPTPRKWDLAIARGTDDVVLKCQKRASNELMEQNRWLRQLASWLAAWHLSGFGGEGHNRALTTEREAIMEDLGSIAAGELDIPGIAYSGVQNKDMMPVGSNLSIDMRRMPVVRIVRPASTGQPRGLPNFQDVPTRYPRPGNPFT